jgi:hypothetical protein
MGMDGTAVDWANSRIDKLAKPKRDNTKEYIEMVMAAQDADLVKHMEEQNKNTALDRIEKRLDEIERKLSVLVIERNEDKPFYDQV